MKAKIEARIKDYKSQIDGGFTDSIMKCKVAELEWVLSLMRDEVDRQDGVMKYLAEKFTGREYKRIGLECSKAGIDIEKIAEFVKYRIEIKKPVKTTRPITAFIKKLSEAKAKGYDIDKVMEIMMDNEWQSFELDWIDKKIPKVAQVQNSLAEFGFNQSEQRLLK